MQVVRKHLFVTVAQDNLEMQVQRVQRVQRVQKVPTALQALVGLETEHDLVLVHLVSVHVMMLSKLNLSTYLLVANSQ
jgi:hypothetical protein